MRLRASVQVTGARVDNSFENLQSSSPPRSRSRFTGSSAATASPPFANRLGHLAGRTCPRSGAPSDHERGLFANRCANSLGVAVTVAGSGLRSVHRLGEDVSGRRLSGAGAPP
jgi:hypothetical protein